MDNDKTTNFTIKSLQYEIVFIYKMWSCGLDQTKVDLQHWANFLLESFEYFSKKFIWEKQIPSWDLCPGRLDQRLLDNIVNILLLKE